MPWENNSGGDRGPWGGGPNRGPRRGSGQNEPNIDEMIEQMRKRMREILPGGGRSSLLVVLAVLLTFWGLSGFYRVGADEQGVVLRFGKFSTQTSPGLNYHLPWPIETAITSKVTTVNRVDIGMRGGLEDRRGSNGVTRDVPEESLMLTGDENIVDVDFSVFWLITNAPDFLFNIQNPNGTVKAVAESTMREIIGQNDIQPILTEQRQKNEEQVKALMQQTLDSYGAGIGITQVKMQKVDPPAAVIDAFRDVQAARADQERARNEANSYANRVVPEAQGEAVRIRRESEAYRAQTVAEADGEATRFASIYDEYRNAPDVTRQRMFLETLESVLSNTNKVIIDQEGSGGVVPYLPLDQLNRKKEAN